MSSRHLRAARMAAIGGAWLLGHAAQAAVIYADNFNDAASGTALNGRVVQTSAIGSTNWVSNSVFNGGAFTLQTLQLQGTPTLHYVAASSGSSSQQAALAFTPGQDAYQLSANLFPNASSTATAPGYLGLTFFGNTGPTLLWQPGHVILSLEIKGDGSWALNSDSSGLGANLVADVSGQVANTGWSPVNAPLVSLTWNTAANTVSGSINGITLFQNRALNPLVSYKDVHAVGFTRDETLSQFAGMGNFQFATVSSVPEPTTGALLLPGLALIAAQLRRDRRQR